MELTVTTEALIDMIPSWIWASILLVDLAVAGLIWWGVTTTARRLRLPAPVQRRLRWWLAVTPVAWLALAPLAAMAVQDLLPSVAPGAPSAATLPLVLTPLVTGLALLRNPTWRRIIEAMPHEWLVGVQFFRNIGAVFFVLLGLGVLPAYFVYPSGYGDLISGLPTLFIAYAVARRWAGWKASVVIINALGMLDFIVAVGIGSGLLHNAAVSQWFFGTAEIVTTPFAYPPMSWIPLFVVPVGLVIHTYSLLKLSWAARTDRPNATSGDLVAQA